MDVHVPVGEFNAALWKRFKGGKIRNVYPLAKYNDIIEKIKTIEENPPCNTPGEYYLFRKFVVINVDGRERLSCKPENWSENSQDANVSKMKFYVALEEIYSYINDAHKLIRHGGRDRIVRNIQNQGVVNITRDTVELFLSFCKVCRPRKKDSSKKTCTSIVNVSFNANRVCDSPTNNLSSESENAERLPIIGNIAVSNHVKIALNQNTTVCSFTRGYIDLIDFSHTPDGDYRFVFVYLDLQTCFCVLHPVRCKCVHEIVSHLLNTFTLIGPPQVLHSSFTDDLMFAIICDIKKAWPEIVIVSGSKDYIALQDVAQNCIAEVKSLLRAWMLENNSSHWSFGLKFTQLRKNTKVGNTVKSPYECFFGRPVDASKLPAHIDLTSLKQAQKEEELLNVINQQNHSELESYEHLQVSLDPNICSLVQNDADQNTHLSEPDSEHVVQTSHVKVEPVSDGDVSETNGFEFSDSSNDVCTSPNFGNLEIVIKQEVEES